MKFVEQGPKLPPASEVLKLIPHPKQCPFDLPVLGRFLGPLLDISSFNTNLFHVDCNFLNLQGISCPGDCPLEYCGGVDVRVPVNSNQKPN